MPVVLSPRPRGGRRGTSTESLFAGSSPGGPHRAGGTGSHHSGFGAVLGGAQGSLPVSLSPSRAQLPLWASLPGGCGDGQSLWVRRASLTDRFSGRKSAPWDPGQEGLGQAGGFRLGLAAGARRGWQGRPHSQRMQDGISPGLRQGQLPAQPGAVAGLPVKGSQKYRHVSPEAGGPREVRGHRRSSAHAERLETEGDTEGSVMAGRRAVL